MSFFDQIWVECKKRIKNIPATKRRDQLLLTIWRNVCHMYDDDIGSPVSVKTALIAEEILMVLPLKYMPLRIVPDGEDDLVFEWKHKNIYYALNVDSSLLNLIVYPLDTHNSKDVIHVNDIPYNGGPIPNEILKHLKFIKD